MFDKPKKLSIFSESGPLIAVAVAAAMLLGLAGPSSAQFFGGYQQRPQPQRGGGWGGGGWGGGGWGGGGGWVGNDNSGPFQQQAPQPRFERRRPTAPPQPRGFFKGPPARERGVRSRRPLA